MYGEVVLVCAGGDSGACRSQSDRGVASSFEFSPYLERMAGKNPEQGHVLVAAAEGARRSGFSDRSHHADGTARLGHVLRDGV